VISQITQAKLARIRVGSAARVMRAATGSPLSTEMPKSPWKMPFVAPEIGVGRKFGHPFGPRRLAGLGMWLRTATSAMTVEVELGLHNPIQRQYWIGQG